MCMGIGEARHDRRTAQIDHRRRRSGKRPRLSVGADEYDPAGAHRERRNHWARVIDGVNVSICKNEIRWYLRSKHRRCERRNCEVG